MTEKFRYPGINYFDTNDADIFFGRNEDRMKLTDKVEIEKTVLLYSRSGLGKTSLLKAGLIPELNERGYQSFYIKPGVYNADTITPVVNIIRNTVQQAQPTFLHKFINRSGTLWYTFKSWQINKSQQFSGSLNEKPIVLIFDQFEEISSYPNEDIKTFKQQLAEILSTNLPLEYQQGLENINLLTEQLTDDELDLLYAPLRIKVVFSIRSDQLSVLNKLTDYLPGIQNVFYELKPLTIEKAKQAITSPAGMEGNFKTAKFSFSEDALIAIKAALESGVNDEVDSAHLQILLQHIEKEIVGTAKGKVVTAAKLGDLNKIYEDYYYDSLEKLTSEKENARHLIEDALMVNGRRISYDKEACLQIVSENVLNNLVENRLLREEPNSLGRTSYEISHDSLIKPISESQKFRKQKEKEIELENKLNDGKEKIARQRRFTIIITLICLPTILSSFMFYNAKVKSDRNEILARNSKDTIALINGKLTESLINYVNAEIRREKAGIEQKEIAISQYQSNMGQRKSPTVQKILSESIKQRDSLSNIIANLNKRLDSLNNNMKSIK